MSFAVKVESFGRFLYCTMMLAAIIATPQVTVKLTLDRSREPEIRFSYTNLKANVVVALFLTHFALLPTSRWLRGCLRLRMPRKYFVYLVLPWVVTCCVKFVDNILTFFSALYYALETSVVQCVVLAMVTYCLIFGMALELMVHWYVLYELRQDGIPTHVNPARRLCMI